MRGVATANAQAVQSRHSPRSPARASRGRPRGGQSQHEAAPVLAGPAHTEPPFAPDSSAEKERRPRTQTSIVVPRTSPGPEVRVPVADGVVGRLTVGELPPGWELKRFAGRPQFEVISDEGRTVFHLATRGASFALHRDVVVDLEQFPILSWSWKVARLPTRGDVRQRQTDDQAAQIYVIFPHSPSPRTSSDVLGYVWDSHAPVGLQIPSPQASNVKITVLESGDRKSGIWVAEQRNIRDDYLRLFGKTPPMAGKVAIMTDSDDTQGQSQAFFDELMFRRAPVTGAPPATARSATTARSAIDASSPSQPRRPK